MYDQIQTAGNARTTASINLKVVSLVRETANKEVTLEDKLRIVLAVLEEEQLVGLIEDGKPYIKGIFPFRWGMYNDHGFRPETEGPLVYFGGELGDVSIGMGGSSVHLEGCYGMTSTSSRSLTSVLARWMRSSLETDSPPQHKVANHYLRDPIQQLEFVAKVLNREKPVRISHFDDRYGESILATPLYVAQVDVMIEDDENQWQKRGLDRASS